MYWSGILVLAVAAQGQVQFQDYGTIMKLWLPQKWEMSMLTSNGAISNISDSVSGALATLGSRNQCLWGLSSGANYVGGCSFSKGASTFSYAFDGENGVLTLTYGPVSSPLVEIVYSEGPNSTIDMVFRLKSAPPNASEAASVLWPSEFVFDASRTQDVVLPLLPGVRFGPPAFSSGEPPKNRFLLGYPGRGVFADIFWTGQKGIGRNSMGNFSVEEVPSEAYDGTSLCMVGVPPFEGGIAPVSFGMEPNAENGSEWYNPRAYVSNLTSASSSEAVQGGVFHTRVGVGLSLQGCVEVWRVARGQTVPGKGKSALANMDRLSTWLASPLLKVSVPSLNLPFAQWKDALYPLLPSPAVVHPSGYEPGGFDHDYPDLLPPASQWGSTADYAQAVAAAQKRGLLVMPYTNPTWWSWTAPTVVKEAPLQNLTTWNLASIVDNQRLNESYGPNSGLVATPNLPFNIARIRDLLVQITTTRSTAHGPGIGCDAIFTDQIGARPPVPDTNPSLVSPNESPAIQAIGGTLRYALAWKARVNDAMAFANATLHTEQGMDWLTETSLPTPNSQGAVGFHGAVLSEMAQNVTHAWCTGTQPPAPYQSSCWQTLPLATMGLAGQAMFYEHDLDYAAFDYSLPNFAYNTALGMIPSLNVAFNTNQSWWLAVATLHREALAPVVVGSLQSFNVTNINNAIVWSLHRLTTSVQSFDFPPCDLFMTVNRDSSQILSLPSSLSFAPSTATIPPGGFFLQGTCSSNTSSTWTGRSQWTSVSVVQSWRNQPLSPGIHTILELRNSSSLQITHTTGTPTKIATFAADLWTTSSLLTAQPLTNTSQPCNPVSLSIQPNRSITLPFDDLTLCPNNLPPFTFKITLKQ